MKWSLQQLNRYSNEDLVFSGEFNFDEFVGTVNGLLSINNANVEGKCRCINIDRYKFDLHITALLELEDSWTLEPVPFKVDLEVTEVFDRVDTDEDVRIIEKNTVDLKDVVWENILLSIPMRIVKDEVKEVNM